MLMRALLAPVVELPFGRMLTRVVTKSPGETWDKAAGASEVKSNPNKVGRAARRNRCVREACV